MSNLQEVKRKIIENKIATLKAKLSNNDDSEDSDPSPPKKLKQELKDEHENVDYEEVISIETEQEPDRKAGGADKDGETPRTAKDLFSVFKPDTDSDTDDNQGADSDNADDDNNASKSKSPASYRKKKYKKEWESVPSFKHWISASVHGNTYFYCKFCKKDYRCGKSELIKHMGSKKHRRLSTQPVTRVQRKFAFRGLLCPVFTLFENRKTKEVNYSATKQYSSFLKTCGIKGVLINDVLGEGTSLSVKERMNLTELWAELCERHGMFLMVQVGGAPLIEVFEMVKHAAKLKVGAIVLMADLYSRPKNHLDIIKYIKLISECAADLPILYHHCPHYISFDMNVSQFLIDITGEIESFVGIIYSTNDLQKGLSALTVNEDKFSVFLGTDEVIIGAIASGFSNIMSNSLNLFAKLVQSICNSVQNGEVKTAQLSQKVLLRALDRICCHGDIISTLKAAMSIVTPISTAITTRPPLDMVWDGILRKITNDLRELAVV